MKPVAQLIGLKRRAAIYLKLADQAEAGDVASAKLLLERMDPTLARQELTGHEGKAIELEHTEHAIAEMPTDVLKELDALADRVNVARGNGTSKGNGAAH